MSVTFLLPCFICNCPMSELSQYPLCRSPEPEPEPQPAKVTDVRLPTHLEPLTYRLELVPFIIPDNFTIRGLVEIGGQSPVVFI